MNLHSMFLVTIGAVTLLLGGTTAGQSIESTEWKLVQVGEEMVVGDAPQGEPTLTLDPEGNRASGTGGCNGFTGGYQLDGDKIEFSPIASTRRMCPEGMDTEDAFFYALSEARSFAVVDSHLEFYDADGERLARFEPPPR